MLETSLREFTEAVEKAEQARRAEGLPLLFGSEFHPISHDWDSYSLESEFHTDEEFNAEKVAELVAQLPGLEGCLIVKNHGPVLAAQLPERLHAHLKVPNQTTIFSSNAWKKRCSNIICRMRVLRHSTWAMKA